ncbi:MAG: (d)CMP kinase [Pseudomonadota bacterium]
MGIDQSDRAAFVIAVDGPAASGKGTLSRRLANELGLAHLDTGLTYRAVAQAMMSRGLPLDDEQTATEMAHGLDLGALDRELLSAHGIGEAASKLAVMSKVRAALVEAQRRFSNQLPGAVLDGRDIGTVVCPDAQLKLYVSASAEERANRRWKELNQNGNGPGYERVLEDLKIRDERDMGREDSPLKPAADAHLLDTTKLDIEAAFRAALGLAMEAKSKSEGHDN